MSVTQKRKSPSSTDDSSQASAKLPVKKKTPEDFKFGRELGHGSFSTVYLARDAESGMEVAIKVLDKSNVLRNKHGKAAVWMERHVLHSCVHPLIGSLIASFHDSHRLYFVLPYASHGELLHWLHKSPSGRFDVETARFYTSELLLALEYLHSKQIVHRDVKPENMLLGPKLHLMLVDFGSAIVINNSDIKPVKFTGTAQFVSPEMLSGFRNIVASSETASSSSSDASGSRSQNGEDSFSPESGATAAIDEDCGHELTYLMDFWALGCVLYHLLSGQMPFRIAKAKGHLDAAQEIELFHKVLNVDYEFPDDFPDGAAKDMISRLLVADPSSRLGNPESGGHSAIKRHPFMCTVDWDSDISSFMERSPPTSMLNIINTAKLDCLSDPSSDPISSTISASGDSWKDVPVGYEAGQRYMWEQVVHQSPVTNYIDVEQSRDEKPADDDSLLTIEGGDLVRYLYQNDICLVPSNDINMPNKEKYLARQRTDSLYDQFTQGRLILDYGILYKRRKLRARKRMFLMVEDIRLLYVDPDQLELKGIVRLSALSTFEVRNNRTFLIRTPGRDYILEDPKETAPGWVERIKRYWSLFFRSPT